MPCSAAWLIHSGITPWWSSVLKLPFSGIGSVLALDLADRELATDCLRAMAITGKLSGRYRLLLAPQGL